MIAGTEHSNELNTPEQDPTTSTTQSILGTLGRIIGNSPVPQFLIDREHRIIAWNTALSICTGIAADEILGTTDHWRAFYPEKRSCLADLLVDENYAAIGEWYEGRFPRPGGPAERCGATKFFPHLGENGRWLHFVVTAVRDRAGSLIGVVETFEDRTRKGHPEPGPAELRSVHRCFGETPGVWWGVSEIVGTTIIARAVSSSPVNQGTLKMDSSGTPMGSPDKLFRNTHLWINQCQESGMTQKPVTFEFTPGPEDDRWFSATVFCNKTPTGDLDLFTWTVRDISEQKRLERQLEITGRKLRMMNDIAWHEIQNKITGIHGYVELSKELMHESPGPKYLRAEEEILCQIDQLLQFTQAYQTIGTRPSAWINVRDAVNTTVSLLDVVNGIVYSSLDNLEVFADPAFGMIFSFLIRYSLKNRKDGIEIHIRYTEADGRLRLTYEDNSSGIPVKRKPAKGTIRTSDDYLMEFIHDCLEFSGIEIGETRDRVLGCSLVISVPQGRYRFNPGPSGGD